MRKAKKRVKNRRVQFRSKFEKDTALSLKREGVNFEYETLKISYTKLATYTPDFIFPNWYFKLVFLMLINNFTIA